MPLRLELADMPAGILQVLAGPIRGEVSPARLIISAEGLGECPPGSAQMVRVAAGGGTQITRQIPFENWELPLHSTLDFSSLAANAAEFLARLHPFALGNLAPEMVVVSVPQCQGVGLEAAVAIFPELRWEGEITARAEPDAKSQKGFRIQWESSVVCHCGEDEWRPRNWQEAVIWCPWLGMIEALARCVIAVMSLRERSRAQGLDNSRLIKAGDLEWNWPAMRVRMAASLEERERESTLHHRLELQGEAAPLVEARGELSLLGHWVESGRWNGLLAPLFVGVASMHVTEIAHEIGLWLVAAGEIQWRMTHGGAPPGTALENSARSRGGIALRLEGRSRRDYESIVVRAGSADTAQGPSGISLACQWAEATGEAASGGPVGEARMAFSGLALWSLEKRRPGIAIRRSAATAGPTENAAPLARLLPKRHWPPQATEQPVKIPWTPA
jgi:hypothetical protein